MSSGRKEKLYDFADVMSTAVEPQTVHKNTLIARGKNAKDIYDFFLSYIFVTFHEGRSEPDHETT